MKRLEDVEDLQLLISSKDTFFYDLGYSPESRYCEVIVMKDAHFMRCLFVYFNNDIHC